jgi:hypothetical protein
MLAYSYTEDKGGKGGNNVVSVIIKVLHELDWIKDNGRTGKQLSIIFDNCGGKNKNNFVLHLALWPVECSFFKKVEIFYIRGHIKNACDRLFNQLKLHYHKKQIFPMGQMIESLNSSANITFKGASATNFFDHGEMFDEFYDKFPPSTIQQNHVLWVEEENPTKMYIKRSNEADLMVINFKKSSQRQDRTQQLSNYTLNKYRHQDSEMSSSISCTQSFESLSLRNFKMKYALGLPVKFLKI